MQTQNSPETIEYLKQRKEDEIFNLRFENGIYQIRKRGNNEAFLLIGAKEQKLNSEVNEAIYILAKEYQNQINYNKKLKNSLSKIKFFEEYKKE